MTHYCSVETRAASMYVDPEPAEMCENEVAEAGDHCGRHDYDDEPEYEREADR